MCSCALLGCLVIPLSIVRALHVHLPSTHRLVPINRLLLSVCFFFQEMAFPAGRKKSAEGRGFMLPSRGASSKSPPVKRTRVEDDIQSVVQEDFEENISDSDSVGSVLEDCINLADDDDNEEVAVQSLVSYSMVVKPDPAVKVESMRQFHLHFINRSNGPNSVMDDENNPSTAFLLPMDASVQMITRECAAYCKKKSIFLIEGQGTPKVYVKILQGGTRKKNASFNEVYMLLENYYDVIRLQAKKNAPVHLAIRIGFCEEPPALEVCLYLSFWQFMLCSCVYFLLYEYFLFSEE